MNINIKAHQRRESEKYFDAYIEGMLKLYIASTLNTLYHEFGFGKKRIDKFVDIAFCDEFWNDVERLNKDGITMGKAEQTLALFNIRVNMTGRSMKRK